MGNKLPRIPVPLSEIEVAPGNVLIDVYGGQSYTGSGSASNSCQNLYWGKVVRVAPSNHPKVANAVANAGAWANSLPKHLKQGDKVMVRGDRAYPVDTLEGYRLFVVNEWDVALKLGDIAVYDELSPAADA